MTRRPIWPAALVLAAGSAVSAQQDHAFTYQGLLKDGGNPANGMYDIQLKAFSAATGGTQSGPTVEVQDVGVADGVFTARVDFGTGVFNGQRRWLEVGFRPGASTGAYTLLDARTEVTSTPYAACAMYPWLPAAGSISYDGNVGIGTTTPVERLTVRSQTSDYGLLHTDGAIEVGSWVGLGAGWYGTRSNHPLHFFTNHGSAAMTIATDRRVMIGTATPAGSVLTVAASGSNAGIFSSSADQRAIMGLATDFFGWGVIGENTVGQCYGVLGSGNTAVYGQSNIVGSVAARFVAPPRGVAVDVVQGLTRVKTLQVLGGADVAEPFDVAPVLDAEPVPGMLVVIDRHNPGALRVASEAYDDTVAGVISGANGLEAGMVLRAPGTVADGQFPVAMAGRVWCYTDATLGAVRPGDRLTTSFTPGHAMRVSDESRAPGAVIGKAMTSLDGGRGLVLVLVNLQ